MSRPFLFTCAAVVAALMLASAACAESEGKKAADTEAEDGKDAEKADAAPTTEEEKPAKDDAAEADTPQKTESWQQAAIRRRAEARRARQSARYGSYGPTWGSFGPMSPPRMVVPPHAWPRPGTTLRTGAPPMIRFYGAPNYGGRWVPW